MKKYLLLILFAATFAAAQYSTSYQQGVTDISSYLPTINAWLALPAKALLDKAQIDDGSVYALDLSGCVWSYSRSTRTYTQQTVLGCSWAKITAKIDPTYGLMIGLLKPDSTCPTGSQGFYWSYGGAAPVKSPLCFSMLYAATGDGSMLMLNESDISGQTNWYNGSSYTHIGTGWTAGYVASSVHACALKGGQLYLLNAMNNTFELFSQQPPAIPVSCMVTRDDDVLMTTTSAARTYLYNSSSSTWSIVTGGVSNISGASKPTILGLDSGGNMFHLNVYAAYISGTTIGSFNGCPVGQCPQGATHTVDIKVRYPHGLAYQGIGGFGVDQTVTTSPVNSVQVYSFDANNLCDPIFGNLTDAECQPVVTGVPHCNVSGANFGGGGGGTPVPQQTYSEYVGSYDANYKILSTASGPKYANATISCGATDTTCKSGTYAACAPPYGIAQVGVSGSVYGDGASISEALSNAKNICFDHAKVVGGAWGFLYNYTPGQAGSTCKMITFYDEKAYGPPCY
jgi:hypothetical protein